MLCQIFKGRETAMLRLHRLPCLLLLVLACVLLAGCGSGATLGMSLEDYVDAYNKRKWR